MRNRTMKFTTAICFSILAFAAITAQAQICQPAPVGLVAWYSGDGNALDSRSRNNGTLQNAATFAVGKVGQGFLIGAGSSGDNVRLASTGLFRNQSNAAIEAWIKPKGSSSIGGNYIFFEDVGINPGTRFGITHAANGKLAVFGRDAAGNFKVRETETGAAPINLWTHFAAIWESGVGIKIYINGALSATLNDPTITGFSSDNAARVRIGAASATDSVFGEFDGDIDELSIYDRALSDSEIAAIVAAGTAGKCKPTATVAPSGQVAWFAGDGDARDFAGTNDGSLQNGAGFAIDKVGQGFTFDGVDDFVNVPHSNNFNSSSLTLEAWVNTDTLATGDGSQVRTVISKYDSRVGGGQGVSWGLFMANGGKLQFFVAQSISIFRSLDTNNPVLTTGTWHHVVGTFDSQTQELKIYVDGVAVPSTLDSSSSPSVNIEQNTIPLRIGSLATISQNAVVGFWDGLLDEVSVYNRALTDTEIISIFNAGIAGKLKETTTTGTPAAVGDVTATFSSAATRRTQQIPLEEADLPALPAGMTATGLFYDIATSTIPSGTVDLCFNLQSFAALSQSEFNERRVLHLENNQWATNRTLSWNFAAKTICARVPSLSPFAIVDSNLAPTAASVSIGGRVRFASGKGIFRAKISLIDSSGNTRTAFTNLFGKYQFDDVPSGETYIVSVSHRSIQFAPSSQVRFASEDYFDIDFIGQ